MSTRRPHTGARITIVAIVVVVFAALLTPSAFAAAQKQLMANGSTISIRSWIRARGG